MNVLGVSFGYHDSAAALISDGRLVAACQQERFSRIKNDPGFPTDAIALCLETAGIAAADLDLVAYHESPLLKFDRVVRFQSGSCLDTDAELTRTMARWLRDGRFDVRGTIAAALGIPAERVRCGIHHRSHAASAFFCSPFERAAVVTLDGVGEYETATISLGEHGRITPLTSVDLPHSIGLFYSAFTAYLGFQVNEGEYKVMGMAAFGAPSFKADIAKMFTLGEDGSFALDQRWFRFSGAGDTPYTEDLVAHFGPARQSGTPFGIDLASLPSETPAAERDRIVVESRRFADIAASVQAVTEDVIAHVVTRAASLTGESRIVMAGGVALNSLANGRLLREHGFDMFIQPAAGDAGSALGAALFEWCQTLGKPALPPLTRGGWGRGFSRAEARDAAQSSEFAIHFDADDEAAFLHEVAQLLAAGNVVGWLHGRTEWGPRALGYRSILADPRRADMQRKVNEKVKFREPFRPFAPAVPAERVHDYFDIGPRTLTRSAPESFMLAVHPVRPEYRSLLPAITHVDGTARVQAVHETDHPIFHRLLDAFGALTGLPILLNTSFNLNGEPIVDTPGHALRTFALSDIDFLAMDGLVLSKQLAEAL